MVAGDAMGCGRPGRPRAGDIRPPPRRTAWPLSGHALTMPDVTASGSVDWGAFGAVLFDLDGVITPTAADPRTGVGRAVRAVGFHQHDYLASVDGRPRYDGVKTFLGIAWRRTAVG